MMAGVVPISARTDSKLKKPSLLQGTAQIVAFEAAFWTVRAKPQLACGGHDHGAEFTVSGRTATNSD
eukprot:1658917-Amphidinium_carterae.1